MDWTQAYATRAGRMGASEIRELLKILEQPGILSFAGGIPDPKLFPMQAVQAASAAILSDPVQGAQALQYTASEGYRPLRTWLVNHMAGLGIPCTIDNIVMTGGSQQGLDFLGKLLVSPADTVLVTAPTYLGALQAFNAYEPRYDRLHLDGNMTPTAYAEAARPGRIACAYAVPDFANPTGDSMPLHTRNRLLDLATALDIPVIEDAAYTALRFEGEPLPSLLALDIERHGHIDAARVVYCGTFSKTISPGLRVGWVCAARDLVHKIVLAKQAADLHSPSLGQMIIHRVAEAQYDQVVAANCRAYASRRDAMLAALDRPHAPARHLDPPARRHVRLADPPRPPRRRRDPQAGHRPGEDRLRPRRRLPRRRHRPQHPPPRLLAAARARDRRRHGPPRPPPDPHAGWWAVTVSNRRPSRCKRDALPLS